MIEWRRPIDWSAKTFCRVRRNFIPAISRPINDPKGNADSWVYVYDATSLKFLSKHATPEVFHGAGGIGHVARPAVESDARLREVAVRLVHVGRVNEAPMPVYGRMPVVTAEKRRRQFTRRAGVVVAVEH